MGKIKQTSGLVTKFGIVALGAYFPKFFRIHLSYMRHNFRAWAALFVAPFLTIKLFMIALFESLSRFGNGTGGTVWHFDIIAIFAVALCFVLAERHQGFRRIYVYAVPTIMALGLLYWAGGNGGYLNIGYLVKAGLIGYLTYRVGRFTIASGYQQLSEGGDKDYSQGYEHYAREEYDLAMPFLEKAAKRGHFKSLFLLGDAYECGNFYEADPSKAAEYFIKSGRKGYDKANARYEELLKRLSTKQRAEIQDIWGL